MTSRTQLPIEVLPNQIRARYPGPAAATCLTPAHHQAGPPARLPLCHSAQGHPQTPQSRSQPGAGGTWAAAPPEVPGRFLSHVVAARFHQFCCFCPGHGHPHPQSHSSPARPRSSLVALSFSLAPLPPGAIYGRSGWIDEGFFLARTPSPPYLGTSSLRLALGIISRDDDTGNLRVRKQLAQTGGQLPLSIESTPGRVR